MGSPAELPGSRFLDLTHVLHEGGPQWYPDRMFFEHKQLFTVERDVSSPTRPPPPPSSSSLPPLH